MRCYFSTAAAFFLLAVTASIRGDGVPQNDFTDKIRHVVFLMLENRSFDHIAGHFDIPGLNGLTGTEKNYINPNEPDTSPAIQPNEGAKYRIRADPDHTAAATTRCIFGVEKEPEVYPDVAPMNGFVMDAAEGWGTTKVEDLEDVILAFKQERIPITYALAKQAAVFDAWYSSVPGPTHPNRMFTFTGTSNGLDTNDVLGYVAGWPQRPFFANLDDAKIDWNVYFHDVPELLLLRWMRNPIRWTHLKRFETFKTHAKEGKLPSFSVIEPQYFGANENDNHPPSDSRKTEALLKDVYETLRASPKWNSTLLIITYDEHGGLYDHVSPPMKDIPNPDGKFGKYIKFNRLGIRVPTIMISPWIKPSVIHRPSEKQRPFPSSEFEHTSVIATLKKVWGLPKFLTARDAWAGTFEDIFSDQIRDDCPEFLPAAPSMSETDQNMWRTEKEPSPMQVELLSILQGITGWAKSGVNRLQSEGKKSVAGAKNFLQRVKSAIAKAVSKLSPLQMERKAQALMNIIQDSMFSKNTGQISDERELEMQPFI